MRRNRAATAVVERRRAADHPRFPVLIHALFLALLLIPAPALAARLTVDIDGISGELLENVRAGLTIEARRKNALTDPEIRELHSRAIEEIERALEPFGYYRPLVTAQLDHGKSAWTARYHVDPGPPLPLDSLDVQILGPGANDPAFAGVRADFPIEVGRPVVHSEYEEAKDRLIQAALKHGYLDGRFVRNELRVDLERYVAVVVLHFQTGPQYRFGPVTFHQDVVHSELVEGYVNFQPGEPLDFNRLMEMEQALGNSPYFSRVEVRPRRDLAVGNEIPIVVELTPAKSEKYSAGVGYGTDNGPHVQARAELRRLNRRGHRSELAGTASASEQSAAVNYHIPWPYPRNDVLTMTAGYARVQNDDHELQRSRRIGPSWTRLWAGWQQSVALVYSREDFEVGLDRGIARFLAPDASWSRFRANDPVDPSEGRRIRYRVSMASDQVLSDASYVRLEFGGKWIRTLRKTHRLLGRIEVGQIWTREFRELPPTTRFFAGGAESVRGFGYHEIGERDLAGNIIGGRALATGSIEYEIRFLPQWGGAVFYDVGGAMRTLRGPYESGAGIGLRWVSPIGIVRADLATPLSDDFRVEFHLAVGPSL